MRLLDGITDLVHMSLHKLLRDSEGQGSLECCSPLGHRVRHDLATEQQHLTKILVNFIIVCITIV